VTVSDRLHRPLGSLRLSVTDRCNLRCAYCMPEQNYTWLPREDLLHFEELTRLAGIFTSLGVSKVRLTGGEPLLRRDLHVLVGQLARVNGVADLALTTNGVRLADTADELKAAGLHRITVSLDTLDAARFQQLTRRDDLTRVRAGLEAAAATFPGFKIDTVLMRGVNDDEMVPLLEEARRLGAELRFIEYMDVGGATRWASDAVVSRTEVLARLAGHYGPVTELPSDPAAPAERFRLPDGLEFGVIASTTQPFCRTCDRSRLTADGLWLLCLYATSGMDLRACLRRGDSDAAIRDAIEGVWHSRTDRGAELRLALRQREAFMPADTLRRDPHLEMHTRGG
jgi:cyclic pyranopterin phosphate synthase